MIILSDLFRAYLILPFYHEKCSSWLQVFFMFQYTMLDLGFCFSSLVQLCTICYKQFFTLFPPLRNLRIARSGPKIVGWINISFGKVQSNPRTGELKNLTMEFQKAKTMLFKIQL